MKYLQILTFLLLSQLIMAQELNIDVDNAQVTFDAEGQTLFDLKIKEDDHGIFSLQTLYNYNGQDVRPLISMGQNEKQGNGQIFLYGIDRKPGIQMDGDQILVSPGGQITFSISGHRILGRNASGQETIRIDANRNNDGRITTDELELIGGSDLSEHFDIENNIEEIEPGLLVSIANSTGTLDITDTKRDKKVVGIISGANGIETGLLMGQKGSIAYGDYPVALTGRTYVYANTENGPIEAGDFLTSSSKAGYAMKVKKFKKAQGAIIGKAMTELESGEGFVLVLVNLQ